MNFDLGILTEFFAKTRNFSGNTGGDVGPKGNIKSRESRAEK